LPAWSERDWVPIEIQPSFTYASMMPNLFGTNIFDIMVRMQIAAVGALLFALLIPMLPQVIVKVVD